MNDIMIQPFLIQNDTVFLTQVLDTELLMRSVENMFYLFVSVFRTILYLGLLLLIGIYNLCYHIAQIIVNKWGWDFVVPILMALSLLSLFVSVISYFSSINKKIEKEFEIRLQKMYLLHEDNYYRINDLNRRLNKIE
jgi:uncharacterized membrane protein